MNLNITLFFTRVCKGRKYSSDFSIAYFDEEIFDTHLQSTIALFIFLTHQCSFSLCF